MQDFSSESYLAALLLAGLICAERTCVLQRSARTSVPRELPINSFKHFLINYMSPPALLSHQITSHPTH